MATYKIELPDGSAYQIESESELTPEQLNAEAEGIQRFHSDTGQDVVASAANAAGRGFIGGAGGLVEGVGDLASLVIGDNAMQDMGRGIKAAGESSFPVNPINEDRFAVKAGQVVGGAAEQVVEFATGAKALGALGMAGRAGQLAMGSMFAKGADSGQDAAAQFGVEDDPWKKAAFTLGGGLIEAGTERLGGFAAEGALARRLGILPNGQGGMSGFMTGVATEGGEEMASNTANNTMANMLVSPEQAAAAGQRLPGYFDGTLEAGALGMVGGAVMGLPMIGSQPAQAQQLPPPAGFTGPAMQPTAPGVPARASAINIPTPVVQAGISEEELAAMEVPQQRIATVAAAIAAAPDPATEKAVLETATVAARVDAISKEAPALEQAAPVIQTTPVEIPVEPSPIQPLPVNEPISQTPPPEESQNPQEAPGILPVRPVPEGPLPQTPQAGIEVSAPQAAPAITPDPIAEYQAPDQDPYSRSDAIVPPPANPLPPEAVAARLQVKTSLPGIASIVTDPTLPWEGRLTTEGKIELNTARLATEEDVDRVFDHELAHLAERDSAMAPDIAAMRAAMPQDFLATLQEDIRSRGYDRTAIPSEVVANLAQQLNARFQQVPAWRQFVQRVKTWAKQKMGLSLNDQDAGVLAARIIARGLQMAQQSQPGARTQFSLPSPPDAPGLFEKFFGADKKVVEDVKETEARNATRRALEIPLLAGIIDGHTPGKPLDQVIADMTDEQRSALHDRIIADFSRITGKDEDARDYRNELVNYIESIPELAGQRNVSTVGLQYTNMVQAAAALSGIYGRTGAFSMIIGTDNDRIKFDAGDIVLTRSDDGRRLGSQSGIGGRIVEFASIMAASHNDALKRMGFTDAAIKEMQSAMADRALTANEIEDIFASATTSPEGPGVASALAKLQRLADAAATTAGTPAGKKPVKTNTGGKGQSIDEYAESLAESLLAEQKTPPPPNIRQQLRKAVMEWIRGDQTEAGLADTLGKFGISGEPANTLAASAVEKRALVQAEREARRILREADKAKAAAARKAFTDMEREQAEQDARDAFIRKLLERFEDVNRISKTDPGVMSAQAVIAAEARTAFNDYIRGGIPESKLTEVFSRLLTPKGVADFILSAQVAKQRFENRSAAMEFWKEAIDLKPERMAKSILSDAVGPLVAKLPVGKIVKAFMAAPAHHRNSAAWRTLQIENWLKQQGIDDTMAAKLSVSMDEMVARVLSNITFQEQEKYLTRKKSIGPNADLPAFAAKYQENRDAIREAIRVGLLTDGTPWQAWFASVTGIQAMTPAENAQVAAWENILSGDQYFPSEKGIASAKLRDFMTRKFGKDPSGWELLASSYDGSALSAGSTGAIQITAPVGRMIGVIAQDMAFSILSPAKLGDVVGNFMKAVDTYIAELPLAFKYDTAGNVGANEAQNLKAMAPMRRDLEIQSKILLDKTASPQSRLLAAARWFRSAQDFLRRGMNAADSAAINMFQRYFESREIQQFMRSQKISRKEVEQAYKASGFTMETAGLMADALGYEGPLRKRFINDAMWDHWKKIATASKLDPEKQQVYLKELLENSEKEAEFQIFTGGLRDRGAVTDPIDGIINITQRIGEGIFRAARERAEQGEVFQGNAAKLAARMVLGFVGIPLNASRAALWYTPLSIVSWINYAAWKAGKFKSNPYERSLGSATSVHQRMREGVVGTSILLLGAALLKSLTDGDDDEGEWKIHGEGPDFTKFPDEAKAWRRTHVKHSIERKNPDGSITTIPFSKGTLEYLKAPLMLLAGISDAQRNARLDGGREPEPGEIMQSMVTQLGMASMSQGVRNATDFRKTVEKGTKEEAFQSQSAFMLTPFLPWSGAERWIRTWNNPEQLEAGFWSRMPFAHYREDARPALNTFGQNLQADPSSTQLASRQFAGFPMVYTRTLSPDDRKVYGWIERTSKTPTAYARTVVEKRIGQSLTDEQWYEYTKASGQVRYNQLLQALDGTLKIDRTGDKKTALVPMKKGLADIDPKDEAAMRQASSILQDIGAASHAAGLEAIGLREPEKEKAPKKKAAPIY